VYIEQYFLEGMCLSYFSPLFGFCLSVDSATNGSSGAHYKIIPSKAHLFSRLLQWYQCCIDPIAPATYQIPPTEMGTEYFLYHKEVILNDFSQRIENLESCNVPRHQVTLLPTQASSRKIKLNHYHKICNTCLCNHRKNNTVNAYYYTDLGSLKKTYSNGSETFFFRLKKRVPSNRDSMPPRSNASSSNNNTIELTCVREYTKKRARNSLNMQLVDEEENEWLEKEQEQERSISYSCESQVTLLSRKRQNDMIDHTYKESDISRPTAISHFLLHKPKYCYEAHCEHCKVKKPVYVFILNVTLSKEVDPPAEELIGMQVEESTSYI
jgi:hypothetical protein